MCFVWSKCLCATLDCIPDTSHKPRFALIGMAKYRPIQTWTHEWIWCVYVVFCIYTCNQVCYARVLDFRRKFIEAAQRYNELSYKSIIAESERMTALKNALICTILASAGNKNLIKLNHLWTVDVLVLLTEMYDAVSEGKLGRLPSRWQW